jgi:hypothetical protein
LQLAPTSVFRKTAADPAFAITGSVKFTLAVIELSPICSTSAIRIRGLAVRKLWSVEIPCGRERKTRQKFKELRIKLQDDDEYQNANPAACGGIQSVLSCPDLGAKWKFG